ncbi:hypothetical protein [Deinococcus geothermalis]|uniref:hypothetical protein n=1 Tax=Deinococcus geothermalis TaxID=68909 RepID=UPI0023533090|nr:hypothetical protein [Deinococcus geothermalis]
MRLLFLLPALFLPSVAAQTFGLQSGMKLEALQKLPGFRKLSSDFTYAITTPPTPNAQFETYMLLVTPKAGLCKVLALGKTNRADSYGDTLRNQFSTFEQLLTNKYGPAEKFDFLKANSLWDEPRDFAMALRMNERYLSAYWTREKLPSLPTDIQAIALEGNALNSTDTYITVGYELRNFAACQQEMKAGSGNGL